MKKRISTIVAAFVIGCVCAPFANISIEAKAAETKTLDVYVIAGQSNASGYSQVSSVSASKDVYTTGFENIYYYGKADGNYGRNYQETVKYGQGNSTSAFGAEIGIADAITEYGNGTETLIFKYAQGGTYLTDNTTNEAFSIPYGNWCPPSMITENSVDGISGLLYNRCIGMLKEAVDLYESNGYTVNLKGTFWMQGEAETDGTYGSANYKGHLEALINDLRDDYAEIFDESAKLAPFVLGKIAPTFNGGGTAVEAVRTIQDQIAASMSSVYCVETDDYVIVDPTTNQPANGCHDRYHFNGNDMLSLGKAVGKEIIVGNKPHIEVVCNYGGEVNLTYSELTGEPIELIFTPIDKYEVKALTKNGVDILSQLNNNTLVVSETEGIHVIEVEFGEMEKYKLTIDNESTKGTVKKNINAFDYYEGQQLVLTVEAKEDYTLSKVTFNGVELTPNSNGKYDITIVEGENVFRTAYTAVGGDDSSVDSSSSSENSESSTTDSGSSGCGSSIGAGAIGGLALVVGAMMLKKRKEE